MATQNHVVVPNFAPLTPTGGALFNQIWKLSRALKKAGWKYLASYDGTKDTSADPALDRWGAGTVSNAGAMSAVIASPTRGRATVTGLSGIVASDKGRFLKISGSSTGANNHYHQIEEVLSSSSVRIDARTFGVAADVGPLTWDIRDPLGDSYPGTLTTAYGWILMRGPSMLKIPITAVPTPGGTGLTFVRGENVVQATTGAEGELVGFVHDGVSTGYLVISPRLRGTGTGVYGWDSGNNIVGDISGATVSQSAATVEYRHELVLGKWNTDATRGVIWLGCWDPVGEAADMLSAMAKLSAATTSPPGGNSDFPTYAWVVWGSSAAIAGAQQWVYSTSSDANGNAQIMCADCIEEENWSADGSWTIAMATLSGSTASQCTAGDHIGFSFQRCDDSEDGDLEPYITIASDTTDQYAASRIANGAVNSTVYNLFSTSSNYFATTGNSCLRGWRGRGSAGDSASMFAGFVAAVLRSLDGSTWGVVIEKNPAWIDRQRTALVPTKVREPLWVISDAANAYKMRKGTPRWFGLVQGGESGDTYDSKKWIQLSSKAAPFVAGPWDGSTTPVLWV